MLCLKFRWMSVVGGWICPSVCPLSSELGDPFQPRSPSSGLWRTAALLSVKVQKASEGFLSALLLWEFGSLGLESGLLLRFPDPSPDFEGWTLENPWRISLHSPALLLLPPGRGCFKPADAARTTGGDLFQHFLSPPNLLPTSPE